MLNEKIIQINVWADYLHGKISYAFNGPLLASFFFMFFLSTVNSQNVHYKISPMIVFEQRTTGILALEATTLPIEPQAQPKPSVTLHHFRQQLLPFFHNKTCSIIVKIGLSRRQAFLVFVLQPTYLIATHMLSLLSPELVVVSMIFKMTLAKKLKSFVKWSILY